MIALLPTRCRIFRFALIPTILFGSFLLLNSNTVDKLASARCDAKILELRAFISGYAQNFTGIPYRHAGQSTRTGFDCSGFTSFVLKEFNVSVSPASRTQAVQGDQIALEEVLPGDLVFFGKKNSISHVAMVVECTDEGIMCVHSTCSKGVMVENISKSDYWRPKMLFARDVISRQAADMEL